LDKGNHGLRKMLLKHLAERCPWPAQDAIKAAGWKQPWPEQDAKQACGQRWL